METKTIGGLNSVSEFRNLGLFRIDSSNVCKTSPRNIGVFPTTILIKGGFNKGLCTHGSQGCKGGHYTDCPVSLLGHGLSRNRA